MLTINLRAWNREVRLSQTREAVMKLRLTQAWINDETKKEHKGAINLARVRTIFNKKAQFTSSDVPYI